MKRRLQSGTALLETAVALPVLTLVLLGAADFGRLSYVGILLGNAANAGARFATMTITNSTDTSAIEQAVMDDLGSSSFGRDFTVEVERFCTCAPDDSAIACGNVCAVAGYSMQPRVYVRVGVQSKFDTLFTYPGVAETVVVTREAQMRAE